MDVMRKNDMRFCPICKDFRPAGMNILNGDKVCLICGANFTDMDLVRETKIKTEGIHKTILVSDRVPVEDRERAATLALRILTSN